MMFLKALISSVILLAPTATSFRFQVPVFRTGSVFQCRSTLLPRYEGEGYLESLSVAPESNTAPATEDSATESTIPGSQSPEGVGVDEGVSIYIGNLPFGRFLLSVG